MSFFHVPDVIISGVSACVPATILENKNYYGFSTGEAEKFMVSTGIERHRIADSDICTSDLCYHAAEKLIKELEWKKEEIGILIFVTQTPDYILPATSCILQDRLGLQEGTVALDISLGCSGWVYGLMVISGFLSSGQIKKGILMVGDTALKPCSREDKSTFPLFGDAGTATAVEFSKNSEGFKFHYGSDGKGYDTIIITEGGYRNQATISSFETKEIEPGIKRNGLNTILDGMNVFSFGITRAPESINLLLNNFNIELNSIDYFIFHQANLFMNETIRKKLKIPSEKVPYSLRNFGNTSSASIPLTMVSEISEDLKNRKLKIICCGFGVGLSWSSVYLCTDKIICPEIIEI
ncbi:MAG: ketoacyl-ACP synthase III [Bacteroidales bacterium]|nr:ketoacyl-ACP synthase III [Bacteroidales bacterium]